MPKLTDFNGLGKLMGDGVLKVKKEIEKSGNKFDFDKFAKRVVNESISIVKDYGDDLQKNMDRKTEGIERKIEIITTDTKKKIQTETIAAEKLYKTLDKELNDFGDHLAKRESEVSSLINGTVKNSIDEVRKSSGVVKQEIEDFIGIGKALKSEVEKIKDSAYNELLDARTWLETSVKTFQDSVPELIKKEIVSFITENLFFILWASFKSLLRRRK